MFQFICCLFLQFLFLFLFHHPMIILTIGEWNQITLILCNKFKTSRIQQQYDTYQSFYTHSTQYVQWAIFPYMETNHVSYRKQTMRIKKGQVFIWPFECKPFNVQNCWNWDFVFRLARFLIHLHSFVQYYVLWRIEYYSSNCTASRFAIHNIHRSGSKRRRIRM